MHIDIKQYVDYGDLSRYMSFSISNKDVALLYLISDVGTDYGFDLPEFNIITRTIHTFVG